MDKPGTLIQCLDFYLEDCLARGESQRTVDGKASNVGLFLRWCLSQNIRLPEAVNLQTFESYRRYLHQYRQPFNGRPLDIATIRNRLTAVKVLFKRLFYHEIIGINPAERLELPKVPRRLPSGFLSVEEIERVLQQTLLHGMTGIRDRAVMETYYATGVRRMELARLKMQDIDFTEGLLTIYRGKGNKDRRVPIAKRACDWIQVYLNEVRPKLATIQSGATLFLDNEGLMYREQQLTYLASKYVKRAGIDKKGACNLFRHSTATLMHENGADIRHVQEMLGHADISTTQVYTHVTINKLREVYGETHPANRVC